tara:strand:+ start:9701 stop:10909 length:1209 start_codon:yes stop_codon:yes gene_type:complete
MNPKRRNTSATSHPVLLALVVGALLTGCATVDRAPVPEDRVETAQVPGFADIRDWGDVAPPGVEQDAQALNELLRQQHADEIARGETVQLNFLALSGGGGDGAYGAGLLTGWSASGTRPEFQVVTGVSTGALIAPFAFLGPAYDDALRRAYTGVGQDDIFSPAILPNLVNGPALTDAGPFRSLVESFIDQDVLDAIAIEHQRGRRLLVATTNIDAGRPVIWDLGEIAASDAPGSLALFRQIIVASAAIPGLFPPVLIDVVADGQVYTELHVDGGITAQIFAYQPQVHLGEILDASPFDMSLNLYLIRNGRFQMPHEDTSPIWYNLMVRSLDVLLAHQAISDTYRIYYLTQRDGLGFNLAYIPEEFEPVATAQDPFNTDYMRALFAFAEAQALTGDVWRDSPF